MEQTCFSKLPNPHDQLHANFTLTVKSNPDRVKRVLIAFSLLMIFSHSTITAQEKTYLLMDFTKPGVAISPTLYGIFFEDINHSADGGIYAELIRNRSFEQSTSYWRLKLGNGSVGSMTTDNLDLLNSAQSGCLKVVADSIAPAGYVGVQNDGYWGVNVVDGREYTLSFYAKASKGFSGAVTAALVGNGGEVYAQQKIAGLTTDWEKYTCNMVASGNNTTGKLALSINAAGTVWFDVVSLFPPTYNNRSNGLRPDLVQKLVDLHPRFMRFPGGNFIEGDNLTDGAFHWKKTIGPVEERPGHPNTWGYRTSDGMGYHEYLQLCEDIGAEPIYVCNVGMSFGGDAPVSDLGPWIQDALDAIEYADGDTTTTWGHLRKVNGHPAPFNMKYIELGNEEWFPDVYPSHYNMFYDSIKKYYPAIIPISDENWPTLLNSIDMYDYHIYTSTELLAQNSTMFDNADRNGPTVYVGEYAVTVNAGTGNLWGAIGEAAYMTGFERNSDIVRMASYAPLFGNLNQSQWNPNAIYFNSSGSYGTPSYYVQKMFATNTGNKYVPVSDSLNSLGQFVLGGAIGLGTWATQSQYDSVTVTSADSVLVDQNFDSTADGWSVYAGTWSVSNGVYRQTSGNTDCRSTYGNITLHNYSYHLKARKTGGAEGFLIIFGYADPNNYLWWNIGGWGNTQAAIEQSINGTKNTLASTPNTIVSNKWYDIRLDVDENKVRCYLDNELMFDLNTGYNYLYDACTVDTVGGDVYLKVVNYSGSDRQTVIKMKGLSEGNDLEGTVQTLTNPNTSAGNSIGDPENIVPVITEFSASDTGFVYTFPQNSVNVFHLVPQSSQLKIKNDTFSIPENSGNGTLVGTVQKIAGNNLNYTVINSSITGAFDINSTTGEISVKDSSLLNYEVNPVITLSVSAGDSVTDTIPAARGTYTVNLTDVNERPGLISNHYYAFASDTAGTAIGQIFVRDEDKGQHHTFSFKSQTLAGLLSIVDSTGELIISDNENLSSQVGSTISFTVDVSDNGTPVLSDEKTYTLEVLDRPVLVTRIATRSLRNNLEIYPNPAREGITVKVGDPYRSMVITIVDSKGRVVYNKKVSSNRTTIRTSDLTNGIYYLRVSSNGQIIGVENFEVRK